MALLVDGVLYERYQETPREHSKMILPMIDELLKEAGMSRQQLDGVAFGRGPGSFVGVRIGAGVAQGIAFALDLPVAPVSTLAAIAQRCYRETGAEQVLAAIDARMQEVYWAMYCLNGDKIMTLQHKEMVCVPENAMIPETNGWIGAGSGWSTYAETLEQQVGSKLRQNNGFLLPTAYDIAVIGQALFDQNLVVPAEQAVPVYLRDKVAEKPKRLSRTHSPGTP